MKQIICIGGATLDYKLKAINTLELASSNPVISFQSFGGVAHNVAANLANLVKSVSLQCLVGDDAEGKNLLSHLKQQQINIDNCLVLPNQRTARYYAILNPHGELHTALIDMQIYENIPVDLFIQHWSSTFKNNIVFIDTNLAPEILSHAAALNATKHLCIDAVSIAKSAKLPQNMQGVFLLKTDRYETQALTNLPLTSITEYSAAAKSLLQRGMKNVLITLGEDGYILANQDGITHVAARPLKNIADVSGAGDAFVAGMLAGLQHDMRLEEACQLGAAAAYLTLQSDKTVADNFNLADLQKLSLLQH
jgi:pseudouridine kinase